MPSEPNRKRYIAPWLESLHPKQVQAFYTNATEVLYGGAAGGGKSHLLRIKAIFLAEQIPGLQIYLFRRSYKELITNHFSGPTGFPVMLEDERSTGFCKISGTPPEIRFANGSVIRCCHCQYEKTVYDYQGAEIHVLLIDELTHFTEFMYNYLRGRCRVPKTLRIPDNIRTVFDREIEFPQIFCGSNPGGTGHSWVKREFIDSAPFGVRWRTLPEQGGMIRQYIPARLDDNPSIDKEKYANNLRGLKLGYLVEAMLNGSWDITAGGAFDDLWDRNIHVVKPFRIPEGWYVNRSFDFGSARPYSVGYWAESDGTDYVDTDGVRHSTLPGDLFRIAEIYGWNGEPNCGLKETIETTAAKIKSMDASLGYNVSPGPADSAIFDQTAQKSTAKDFARAGVRWLNNAPKGPHSRENGLKLFREYLSGSIDRDGHPGLFVFSSCLQFIRTVPLMQVSSTNPEDVDSSQEDHIYDEARYRIMSGSRRGGGESGSGFFS